ncbi:MAG: hypothetical protein ABIZ49_11070 [Opitutaceae bacterium]
MHSKPAFATLVAILATGFSGAFAAEVATAAEAPTIKIQADKEKNFGDSTTIVVPTIYLRLAVAGKVSVAKQGSALSAVGGGSTNTVRASAHFTVDGLDKTIAQGLAKKAYDDFVAGLRAAGYTVKTYEDIKDMDVVKAAARMSPDANWGLPIDKDVNGAIVSMVATPTDAQAFKPGFGGAVIAPFQKAGRSALGEGTILIPSYVIYAPVVWGEKGGGYKTISAQVNVAPGMNLAAAYVPLLTSKGAWGGTKLLNQPPLSDNVGELVKQDTTAKAANALGSALSLLTGAGKISGSSANYVFKIDPVAYEAAALRGISAFHAETMKVIVAAKK